MHQDLHGVRLARDHGLVSLHARVADDPAVGRDLVAQLQPQQVAHHDLGGGQRLQHAVSHHAGLLRHQCAELLGERVALGLLREHLVAGQHDDDGQQHGDVQVGPRAAVHQPHDERGARRDLQQHHQQIGELQQEEQPLGDGGRRRQHVGSVPLQQLGGLLRAQALALVGVLHVDVRLVLLRQHVQRVHVFLEGPRSSLATLALQGVLRVHDGGCFGHVDLRDDGRQRGVRDAALQGDSEIGTAAITPFYTNCTISISDKNTITGSSCNRHIASTASPNSSDCSRTYPVYIFNFLRC
mmetsp:Transcript_23501/g.32169  ORF Transcript_23501/g.32169 Transcript_23501/m.32169 type:complete len:297 (-) Transcript_23501:3098-3988(-)